MYYYRKLYMSCLNTLFYTLALRARVVGEVRAKIIKHGPLTILIFRHLLYNLFIIKFPKKTLILDDTKKASHQRCNAFSFVLWIALYHAHFRYCNGVQPYFSLKSLRKVWSLLNPLMKAMSETFSFPSFKSCSAWTRRSVLTYS